MQSTAAEVDHQCSGKPDCFINANVQVWDVHGLISDLFHSLLVAELWGSLQ